MEKYKSKAVVKNLLRNGTLHSHSVRPKDKAKYKSHTYQIFNLIYDEHGNVVEHFCECRKCENLFKIILKNGNHKMLRHKCFKIFLAKQTNDSDMESDNEMQVVTLAQKNILTETFFELINHFNDTSIPIEKVEEILPLSWDDESW